MAGPILFKSTLFIHKFGRSAYHYDNLIAPQNDGGHSICRSGLYILLSCHAIVNDNVNQLFYMTGGIRWRQIRLLSSAILIRPTGWSHPLEYLIHWPLSYITLGQVQFSGLTHQGVVRSQKWTAIKSALLRIKEKNSSHHVFLNKGYLRTQYTVFYIMTLCSCSKRISATTVEYGADFFNHQSDSLPIKQPSREQWK